MARLSRDLRRLPAMDRHRLPSMGRAWGWLRTRTQLRKLGLSPGGPPRAKFFYQARCRWVALYLLTEAQGRTPAHSPLRPAASPALLAVLIAVTAGCTAQSSSAGPSRNPFQLCATGAALLSLAATTAALQMAADALQRTKKDER